MQWNGGSREAGNGCRERRVLPVLLFHGRLVVLGLVVKRSPLHRKGWMNRLSDRQRTLNAEFKRTRQQRAEQAEYRCEAQIDGVCNGYGVHAHHIRRRSQGGDNGLPNLLWVCSSCHGWIHANPEESFERHFLARNTIVPRRVSAPRASTTPSGGPFDWEEC